MDYITFITAFVLIVFAFFKSEAKKTPGQIISEAEKAYRDLMERISKCNDIDSLHACHSRIEQFRDTHSWKLMDGCDMVDSLERFYEEMFDTIVFEGYPC